MQKFHFKIPNPMKFGFLYIPRRFELTFGMDLPNFHKFCTFSYIFN